MTVKAPRKSVLNETEEKNRQDRSNFEGLLQKPVLKKRLLKGTGALGFSQSAQFFIRLAEVPLLLAFWDTQLYGEWLMLSAIPSYLSISDGGFAAAARREMTMRSGSGDHKGALAVFQSTWLLLIVVSIGAVLLAAGFGAMASLHDWLGFSVMTAQETSLVLVLLVAHVLVGFPGSLLQGGFWVSGRYPTSIFLSSLSQILEFGGLAVAVALGGGPVQAASGYLAGRILGISLIWLGQRRSSPWLIHGFKYVSLGELRCLTAPAFASLAFPLGNALNIQGMRLIVGLTLGPSSVVVFVTLRTLSSVAMKPRAVVNQLIQPELALAYGAGDFSLFRRIFLKSCQLALWSVFAVCLIMALPGDWILSAWTVGKIAMHWPAYLFLLSSVLVNSIWYTALMVPYATNRHGRIAVLYTLVYGAGAFGLGYFATASMGLAGVGLSLLLVEAAMAGIVIRSSLRMAQMRIIEWIKAVMKPPYDIFSQSANILRGFVPVRPSYK